jgi:hypothetical protein
VVAVLPPPQAYASIYLLEEASWDDYQHGQVHPKMLWEHFDTDYIMGKGSLAQVFLG